MAEAGVITEFLAKVGFKADGASLKAALGKVAAFGATIGGIAMGAAAAVMKIADEYDALGRSSEKIGVPVAKLQELNYIAEQTGASADAVSKSLEGIVSKNPRIKDAAKALENAGDKMKRMSKAGREAYAARMGIDPTLIPMLTKDVSGLKDEFAQLYAVAGTDAQAAAESSRSFLAEIGKLKALAIMLANAVGVAFIGRIQRDVEKLRRGIMENFDKIKRALEAIINFALRVVGAFAQFAGRIIGWISKIVDWFYSLDESQQTVIVALGALLAAWRLLNAGFLATPLGMILLGLAGIVGLVEDYLTYMEGGESWFDWGPWEETITKCVEALKPILGVIKGVAQGIVAAFGPAIDTIIIAVSGLFNHFKLIFGFIEALFSGDLDRIMAAGKAIIDNFIATVTGVFDGLCATISSYFGAMWPSVQANFPDFAAWAENAANSITSLFGTAIQWVKDKLDYLVSWMPDWVKEELGISGTVSMDAITPPTMVAPPTGPALTPSPAQTAALGGRASDNRPHETSVDLKQQTTINVYGNGDAQAVGSAVAARQGDVNAQMVRHTKGAVQ